MPVRAGRGQGPVQPAEVCGVEEGAGSVTTVRSAAVWHQHACTGLKAAPLKCLQHVWQGVEASHKNRSHAMHCLHHGNARSLHQWLCATQLGHSTSHEAQTSRTLVDQKSPRGLTDACAEASPGIESSGLRSSCCMEPTASRYMPCMLPQTPLPSSPSSCRLVVTRSSCRQPSHCCMAILHAIEWVAADHLAGGKAPS